MKCPYCPAQIAYLGEKHECPWPELSNGDPLGPEDFGGSDEGSHYMSSIQGMKALGLDADDGCSHTHPDGRSAIVPSKDPDYHRCELCKDDTFQVVPDEELGRFQQPETEKDGPTKQWIVIRTDLKMLKGKIIAQGAHS